jgi:hypothetical protein
MMPRDDPINPSSTQLKPPARLRLSIAIGPTPNRIIMPRNNKYPVVYLALSPAMLSAAFDIAPRHVYDAIEAGHLEVRQLPGTIARRIFIADAERWFRDHWLKAKHTGPKRKSPHV